VGGIGSYEADLDTMQLRFSDNLYRLLGQEPQSFTPTFDWLDSVSHPEDAAPVRQVLAQAVAGQKPYYYQRRIYKPCGEMRYQASHGKVVCDAEGRAVKLLGVDFDVTAIRVAEARLQEYQVILQAVIESAPVAIAVYQAIRNENGRVIDFAHQLVNRETERQTGNSPLTRRQYLETFPGPQAAGLFRQLVWVVEIGVPHCLEMNFTADDTEHWYLVSAAKLGDGLVVISQDMTDHKRVETENLALKSFTATIPP
jgi:PAS domain-containing protein